MRERVTLRVIQRAARRAPARVQRLVGLDCGFEKIQKSNPVLDWIWIENPFWWIVGLSPSDWIANPIHEFSLPIKMLYLDPKNWSTDSYFKYHPILCT